MGVTIVSKQIYACLAGEWVNLNDDPDCVIGQYRQSPYIWWEEGADIYSPVKIDADLEHSAYGLPYVNIHYKGIDYRINPMFIQVVTK